MSCRRASEPLGRGGPRSAPASSAGLSCRCRCDALAVQRSARASRRPRDRSPPRRAPGPRAGAAPPSPIPRSPPRSPPGCSRSPRAAAAWPTPRLLDIAQVPFVHGWSSLPLSSNRLREGNHPLMFYRWISTTFGTLPAAQSSMNPSRSADIGPYSKTPQEQNACAADRRLTRSD